MADAFHRDDGVGNSMTLHVSNYTFNPSMHLRMESINNFSTHCIIWSSVYREIWWCDLWHQVLFKWGLCKCAFPPYFTSIFQKLEIFKSCAMKSNLNIKLYIHIFLPYVSMCLFSTNKVFFCDYLCWRGLLCVGTCSMKTRRDSRLFSHSSGSSFSWGNLSQPTCIDSSKQLVCK